MLTAQVELPLEVDAVDLYETALLAGITLAPGPIFSARQRYQNFVRLNYAYGSPGVAAAIERLGQLVVELSSARL